MRNYLSVGPARFLNISLMNTISDGIDYLERRKYKDPLIPEPRLFSGGNCH
jgi:hypothetical protein